VIDARITSTDAAVVPVSSVPWNTSTSSNCSRSGEVRSSMSATATPLKNAVQGPSTPAAAPGVAPIHNNPAAATARRILRPIMGRRYQLGDGTRDRMGSPDEARRTR
jgi:hypothetical protein